MAIRLTQFEELWSAVNKYNINAISHTEIDKLEKGEGIDIKSDDIFHTTDEELFTVLKDGSIRKIIIHIVDISSWKESWGTPRFHIYHCKIIQEMSEKGRKYRYRASSRTDGKFYLIKGKQKWYSQLEICSKCLDKYNIKFKKKKTKQNFIIPEYINQSIHYSDFQEIKQDICTIPNTYSKSWNKISKSRKEMCNYVCESCDKDFSNRQLKFFLHVHHIDANKQNNTLGNLKVLCIECHAKEYNHEHIKHTKEYKQYMNLHKSNVKFQLSG